MQLTPFAWPHTLPPRMPSEHHPPSQWPPDLHRSPCTDSPSNTQEQTMQHTLCQHTSQCFRVESIHVWMLHQPTFFRAWVSSFSLKYRVCRSENAFSIDSKSANAYCVGRGRRAGIECTLCTLMYRLIECTCMYCIWKTVCMCGTWVCTVAAIQHQGNAAAESSVQSMCVH